jgi:GNAT superfamily N-acetyltransferase
MSELGSSVTPEDVEIMMVRDDIENVPPIDLPDGYVFRNFQTGDESAWTEIQRASDPFNVIDDGLFEREYGSAADDLPDRMWFVVTDNDEAIGTISSWWEHGHEWADDRGRIHWVAVRPDHQRRGISKPMMTKALTEMALHHTSAMLDTSSGRPWAVKVYLDFGFLPASADLADPEMLQAWRNVQDVIDHPSLHTLPDTE